MGYWRKDQTHGNKYHFQRELVESGLIWVMHEKDTAMQSDLFTKNLATVDFEQLAKHFVGKPSQNKGKHA